MEDVAVEITNLVAKGLDGYYDSLSVLGYKPQSDIEKLLILSFIEEMLTGEMRFLITEADYKAIDRALNCLYGSCLIPFPQYQGSTLFGTITDGSIISPRITEDSNIRFTEDDVTRFRS